MIKQVEKDIKIKIKFLKLAIALSCNYYKFLFSKLNPYFGLIESMKISFIKHSGETNWNLCPSLMSQNEGPLEKSFLFEHSSTDTLLHENQGTVLRDVGRKHLEALNNDQ